MRFTLSSSVLPSDSGKCNIIPEGVDQSGGGGGSAPPAAAAPPAPASQVPDPSSLRVISRPGSTSPPPAQQAPAPAAPQGTPQGGGGPAQQQQQQGQQPSPYITRDELKTVLAELLSQNSQQLGQTSNQGSGQSAAPQTPAGQSNPTSGATQQQGQQSQLLAAQATPEFLAVQTKVREQEQQIREQAQALAEIQKAKAEAEYKADVASATNAAQRALTDHPTYRMQPVAAAQAVEVMLLKGRIGIHPQADGSKQPWVMLPNPQTGKTDVFPLHEGVVKWLESSEGAFYRPQVKPGMGAMASTPGHAPISVPAQTQVSQGSKTPGSLQEAYEKQQALSQGRGTGF